LGQGGSFLLASCHRQLTYAVPPALDIPPDGACAVRALVAPGQLPTLNADSGKDCRCTIFMPVLIVLPGIGGLVISLLRSTSSTILSLGGAFESVRLEASPMNANMDIAASFIAFVPFNDLCDGQVC
jgi:hypothetical protein